MNIQALGSPAAPKPDDRAVPVPVAAARAADSSSAPPSRAQVAAAVKRINESMPAAAQSLEFSIDEDSKETIVKIVDQNTKEVVRQIPTVEALAIAKSLDKMMGLLINQRA